MMGLSDGMQRHCCLLSVQRGFSCVCARAKSCAVTCCAKTGGGCRSVASHRLLGHQRPPAMYQACLTDS